MTKIKKIKTIRNSVTLISTKKTDPVLNIWELCIRICFGPPWRDVTGTYFYRFNTMVVVVKALSHFKSGLGQGFRASDFGFISIFTALKEAQFSNSGLKNA